MTQQHSRAPQTPQAAAAPAPGLAPGPAAAGEERGTRGAAGVYRGRDRRSRPTPRFSRYSFFGGRRRHVRRAVERDGAFVDRYSMSMLAIVLWVSLMNIGDSFFTIRHLQHGGIELNPLAQELLRTGKTGFVLWKGVLIGVALLVLTVHKNFGLARAGLWLAAGGYTLLCGYHLYLYSV